MYPHQRSLVKQLTGKPFVIIGVNSDSDLDVLREIVKEKKLAWRSFQNSESVDGTISENWGIRAWPTLFLLDEQGTIRWTGHAGDIDGVISELLGEMGHEVTIVHEHENDDTNADASDSEIGGSVEKDDDG